MTIILDTTPLINHKFQDSMAKMNETYETTKDSLAAIRSFLSGLTPEELYPVFSNPEFVRIILNRGTMPTAPTIDFPEFTIPDVDVPIPGFHYSDSPYSSELREAMKEKLTSGVTNGGTGLGAEVEDAIWRRNEDRDNEALQDELTKAAADWAEANSGYEMPDGVLASMQRRIYSAHMNNRQTASKEIAIAQAEMGRKQEEVYIREGNQLEATMEGKHSADETRKLEAAKVEPEIIIRGIEAALAKVKVIGEVFNALASKAAAQAQVFKAQIDGFVAESDVSAKEVDASVKLYDSEVRGAQAQSEASWRTDSNKIEQVKNFLAMNMTGVVEIAKLAAQVTAALATSVSASASAGSSFSSSQSESDSTSTSHNYQHNDDRDYI